ncbi:uncharacterized protein LOC114956879 isoform X2 [Acropora millepora]|uniref:uncharacterized protein LOC114956879 isoform X2 n=1 Tax=Acropora millepora TaxID=45264 RepID=UPI001CF2554A|nr:uncharacterized protein LOC114956879 isoform X2 [Acropora millepora]
MPALASIVWIALCVLPNRVVEGEDHSFRDETLRNSVPICRLLCGSERTNPLRKERPMELCSRGCVRNYKDGELSGSFQAKERTRRANENPEEKACLNPTRDLEALKARMPSDIWVNFEERKPNITVRWSRTEPIPFPGSRANWTWYALMYHDSFKQKNRCILIPKEQNEWIIRNGDDWEFPHTIYLGVSTYPYNSLELKPYAPIPKPPLAPPTTGELSGSLQAKEITRRANENPEEKACLNPTADEEGLKAMMPSDIWVNFEERKPNITVRWSRTEPSLRANWTWYALMYHDSFKQKNRCILIPKEQNEWIIRNGDDWEFPHTIYLGVSTYPYFKLELKPYAPIPKPPIVPPTTDSRPANKVIVALVGVTAGILLLLLFLFAYRKRFGWFSLCSTGFVREPVVENSKINNSCVDNDDVNEADVKYIINDLPLKSEGPEFFYACYFPENEKFTRAVAGIVNYFRQNGYPVVMDVMSSNEMVDLGPTRWAEQQIKKAHKILVFLSPGILRLCGAADEDKQSLHQENERVWYEMSLLRTIYSQTHSAAKMVCITLPQGMVIDTRDIPLWAEMRYRWPKDKRKILNRLNDRPFILPL